MEKNHLKNNHGENNMEKHHGENFIKCSYMKGCLSFSHNVGSAADAGVWSASTKLPGPRAFRPVVVAAVAVVIAPFFAAIIIAMWHG